MGTVSIRSKAHRQTPAALDRPKRAAQQSGALDIGKARTVKCNDGRDRHAHPVPGHRHVSSTGAPPATHARRFDWLGRSRSCTQSERLSKAFT